MAFKLIYTKSKKKLGRKDLKKLSKIDRIDYLLQRKEIQDHYSYKPFALPAIIWAIFYFVMFYLLWIAAFGYPSLVKWIPYMPLFGFLIKILCVIFLFEIILCIILALRKSKEIKQLNKEKFK